MWRPDRRSSATSRAGVVARPSPRISARLKRKDWFVYVKPPFAGPEGFHRIRHYGLLASADCKSNIARAKELMATPTPEVDPPVAQDTVDPHTTSNHRPPCPCCGGRMIIVEVFARAPRPTALWGV
jgi:hypothetical protein